HNPSSTSLILAHDIVAGRARGMKTVVIDPRRIGIGANADLLMQPRPGTDGALALAMIHCLIEESWFDAPFARHWTNGPLLLNSKNGQLITEADLVTTGSADRFVAWDEKQSAVVLYDPITGAYERDNVRPGLFGARSLRGKNGEEILCKPVFERLGEIAARFSPEKSVCITRVPAEKVWQSALLLAHHRPASLYMWNGIGQHTNATQTSRAIAALYALLGDYDRPGGNVIFPKVPTHDAGGKEFLTKQAAALRIGRERKPLGPPASPGNCAAYDIFTAILDEQPYPVKAFLAFGCNPVMSNADAGRAREALRKLEFGVGIDLFMTPTTELCDYVLPATSFLEMANVTTAFEHRPAGKTHLQYRPAAVEPLYERRSDTWIVFELAKRMGMAREFWDGDIEAAYAYELAPAGISLQQLKNAPGGISRPLDPSYQKYAKQNRDGVARGFATPSKRVELYSIKFAAHGYPALPEYVEPALSPLSTPDIAADYPLILTNAKFTSFVHSQQRALATLRKVSPEPSADLHPETAARHGVKNKQWMIVETPRGAIKVKARVTPNILSGVVCVQHGWWQACNELDLPGYSPYDTTGANPGTLIGADVADPISGSLPHRSYLCRIRPG
ncbi:MAG TPA: molybdopterin-dependent oxidoreductase, partial [Candidatus Binatia bacterium]|nr:molybdopterin-dependent oxidoreductase [Candidatus Binatia bacterium]